LAKGERKSQTEERKKKRGKNFVIKYRFGEEEQDRRPKTLVQKISWSKIKGRCVIGIFVGEFFGRESNKSGEKTQNGKHNQKGSGIKISAKYKQWKAKVSAAENHPQFPCWKNKKGKRTEQQTLRGGKMKVSQANSKTSLLRKWVHPQ